jgi:hypothetical protein
LWDLLVGFVFVLWKRMLWKVVLNQSLTNRHIGPFLEVLILEAHLWYYLLHCFAFAVAAFAVAAFAVGNFVADVAPAVGVVVELNSWTVEVEGKESHQIDLALMLHLRYS